MQAAAPAPCKIRNPISISIVVDNSAPMPPMMKITEPPSKTFLRPNRSDSDPLINWLIATDSIKALSTSCARSAEAEKSSRKMVITGDRMGSPRLALDAARVSTPMGGTLTGNTADEDIDTLGYSKKVRPRPASIKQVIQNGQSKRQIKPVIHHSLPSHASY